MVTKEQETVLRIFFRNREGGEKKGRTENPKIFAEVRRDACCKTMHRSEGPVILSELGRGGAAHTAMLDYLTAQRQATCGLLLRAALAQLASIEDPASNQPARPVLPTNSGRPATAPSHHEVLVDRWAAARRNNNASSQNSMPG